MAIASSKTWIRKAFPSVETVVALRPFDANMAGRHGTRHWAGQVEALVQRVGGRCGRAFWSLVGLWQKLQWLVVWIVCQGWRYVLMRCCDVLCAGVRFGFGLASILLSYCLTPIRLPAIHFFEPPAWQKSTSGTHLGPMKSVCERSSAPRWQNHTSRVSQAVEQLLNLS